MRKAITPVISIIILLLITISLAGTGWTYMSGYYEAMTAKQIKIVEGSALNNEVMVLNIGTAPITESELRILVNGKEAEILNPQIIEPKKSARVIFANLEQGSGLSVKIMSAGSSTSYSIGIEAELPESSAGWTRGDLGDYNNGIKFVANAIANNFGIPYDDSVSGNDTIPSADFWERGVVIAGIGDTVAVRASILSAAANGTIVITGTPFNALVSETGASMKTYTGDYMYQAATQYSSEVDGNITLDYFFYGKGIVIREWLDNTGCTWEHWTQDNRNLLGRNYYNLIDSLT